MTEEQLNQIIAQGEGLKIEFKEATDSVPKSVYETVVSFSNTDGGTIQKWLELPDETLPHLQKGLNSVALPAALSNATWEELILHLVPSWQEKGTQLPALRVPENQVFEEAEVKKVSSWAEKSGKLLQKKYRYLISILSLTTEPATLKELLNWLEYKNRTTFTDNYLKPLRQEGLIAFTNPEKPTDPDNKYVITEAGKAFLAGM